MTQYDLARHLMQGLTLAQLQQNAAGINAMPMQHLDVYSEDGRPIAQIDKLVALRVIQELIAAQRPPTTQREIVNALTEAALYADEPLPIGQIPYFGLSLSAWVGIRTPAWHTVFSYSSPEPTRVDALAGPTIEPWFCSLDPVAQRTALLLVAEAERD